MEKWMILIIVGVVIILLLIVLKISKRKKEKEFLIFKNTDEKKNKISYFALHRPTGIKSGKFGSLNELENHINKFNRG
ncbi:hypothetical protein ES703_31400 [subsurface metagenome]